MSVQPFPQLLSAHTHMHTPTHLSVLSQLYVRRVNGVIQESEFLAVLTLTLGGEHRHRVLSNTDKCGNSQKLGLLSGSFLQVT